MKTHPIFLAALGLLLALPAAAQPGAAAGQAQPGAELLEEHEQRPLETLAGVAIPWFNQPGGGSAYLLPSSIEELLAEGDLIELDPGEPPVD